MQQLFGDRASVLDSTFLRELFLQQLQQLLGDRASVLDSTFLRELFLQRLPPNARMVLASTKPSTTLEEIAELADKVVEVAAPTVAATSAPPFPELLTEIEQLRAEVQLPLTNLLAGIIRSMARTHATSLNYATSLNHQTRRPAISGDKCVWA